MKIMILKNDDLIYADNSFPNLKIRRKLKSRTGHWSVRDFNFLRISVNPNRIVLFISLKVVSIIAQCGLISYKKIRPRGIKF